MWWCSCTTGRQVLVSSHCTRGCRVAAGLDDPTTGGWPWRASDESGGGVPSFASNRAETSAARKDLVGRVLHGPHNHSEPSASAAIDALDRNLSWSKTASFLFLLFLPAPIASDQYTLCFGIIAARRQHESSSANLRSAHFCSPTFLRSKPCSPRDPADSAPNQRGPPPPSPPCLAIAHPPTCPILTQVWTRAAPGDQQTCLWTQTSLLLFPQQLPARPPQFELEQHPSLTATA